MTHRLLCPLALAGLLLGPTLAQAQPATPEPVYRCGPDGRSYSSTPCADGRPVNAADPRNAAQQREGRETAERERRLADRLIAERVQREKATIPAAAGHIGPSSSHSPTAKAKAKSKTKPKAGKPPGKPKPKAQPKKTPKRDQVGATTSSRYLAQS